MASIAEIQDAVKQENEVVDVPIYQRNGEPYVGLDGEPSTIGVVGAESDKYRQAQQKHLRKLTKGRRRNRTVEEALAARVDLAAQAVVRWSGWDDGKKDMDCTPENVRTVLGVDHILIQVEEGIEEHQRFFSSASTS